MKITSEQVKAKADLIADILNSGKVCEVKIEKSEITLVEIKRKLKKA